MSVTLTNKEAQDTMDTLGALVAVVDNASIETPASDAARNAAGDRIREIAAACPTCTPPGNTPPPQ